MSNRKYVIGFGLIIEHEEHNKIRKMQTTVADVTNNIDGLKQPPHITVRSPFELKSKSDIAKMIEIVDVVASRRNPFRVELDGFAVFKDEVVYLRPSNGDQIASVHADIATALNSISGYAGVKEKYENPIFHVTIARNLSEIDFKKSSDHLKIFDSALPIIALVQKIGLFMQVDDQWVVVYSQEIKRK